MKHLNIILLLVFFISSSCINNSSNTRLSHADSLRIAREDSIAQVKKDSLAKVEAERQAYLNRPWKIGTYNNEFGEPTNEKFIKTRIDGYFSNSATSNEYLYVEVMLDKDAAGIFLHEYKKSNAAEKFIGTARIKMKNSSGKTLQIISASEWNQNGGILIKNFTYVKGAESYDYSKFRNFIKQSVGDIKVVIYDEYSSTYRFNIDATGFIKEFSQL